MSKTIDQQREESRAIVKILIDRGWEPEDIIGVTINATLILAGMSGTQCGFASTDEHSILVSQVNHEHEALDYIESRLALERVKEAADKAKAADEARIECGGSPNVVSIHKNK